MEQAVARLAHTAPTSRAFVSFVHMSVTIQGLLIVATGVMLLAADVQGYEKWHGLPSDQDWLLILPTLLAALYLMVSEKILRDRHLLDRIHALAGGAPSPSRTAELSDLFLRTRSLYHFLMFSCFVLYAAGHLPPDVGLRHELLFHLKWGLLVVFYGEFVLCSSTQHSAYAQLLSEDVSRGKHPLTEGRIAPHGPSTDHRAPGFGGAGWRPAVLAARSIQGAAVVACLLLVVATIKGVPVFPSRAWSRWISDGAVIILGLTFMSSNLRRERFLRLANGAYEALRKTGQESRPLP